MTVKLKRAKAYNNGAEKIKKDSAESELSKKYTDLRIYSIPGKKEIKFKAMITEFSDEFSQNWESETVYGRMDDIQSYTNTTRQISVAFDVAAFSGQEAYENMKKLSELASFQYPAYESHYSSEEWMFANANTISTPPLVRVKFANFITHPVAGLSDSAKSSGLLCKMDGLTFSPNNDMGYITPQKGALLPKHFNLSLSFTVLHTHELGWDMHGQKRENPNSKGQRGGTAFPYLISNSGGGEEIDQQTGDKCAHMATGIASGDFCNRCGIDCPDDVCAESSDAQCFNDDMTQIQEEMNETAANMSAEQITSLPFTRYD